MTPFIMLTEVPEAGEEDLENTESQTYLGKFYFDIFFHIVHRIQKK